MLQKFKPFILFFVLSLMILFITGYYHWWENTQNITQVPYISHPDWSKPVAIATELQSKDYRIIPEEDRVIVFWIKKSTQTFVEKLYVETIDYQGQRQLEPVLLEEHQNLKCFAIEKTDDRYHLFLFMGESESNLNLVHRILNQDYQVISQQTLAQGFAYTTDIKSSTFNNAIYLTWSTTKGKYNQIDLASLDLLTNAFKIKSITEDNLQHLYPNFDLANNTIHIAYLQRDPTVSSNLRAVDIGNEYQLFYQKFDLRLDQNSNPIYIAAAALTMGTTAPQILYDDGLIHIIWNKFYDEVRTTSPGRWLYYTTFNPSSADQIMIHRLTPDYSYAFEPTLLKNNKELTLAYINSKNQDLVISSVDPSMPALKEVSRLFTDQKIGFQPHLFIDPSGDLNISWIELKDGIMQLFFATTKYPHKPEILETLGMKIEGSDSFVGAYLWFIIFYFFIFPLYSVFLNIDLVLWPLVFYFGLLFLSWRYKKLAFLQKVNNEYMVYFSALLVMLLKCFSHDGYEFLITNFAIPDPLTPYIIGLSFIASLFYMWRIKFNRRHAVLIGVGCFMFWIYLINQANFIFHVHQYTF